MTLLTAFDRAKEKLKKLKGLDVMINCLTTHADCHPMHHGWGLVEAAHYASPPDTELQADLEIYPSGMRPLSVNAIYRLEDITSKEPNYIDEALHIEDSFDKFSQEDIWTLRIGYVLFKTYQMAVTGQAHIPTIRQISTCVNTDWRDYECSLEHD